MTKNKMEVEVSLQTTLRYCGFTHYKDDPSPIEDWLKKRFEVFCVYNRETAASGIHVQWYGETRLPWNKSDTYIHGVRGMLGKHMPATMYVAKAKRWSKQLAKKDRDRNCEYVSKGVIVACMSDGFAPCMLWKASDWLINQCNMDSSIERHELMYDEHCRRLIGN
jgi:hypothetical protein